MSGHRARHYVPHSPARWVHCLNRACATTQYPRDTSLTRQMTTCNLESEGCVIMNNYKLGSGLFAAVLLGSLGCAVETGSDQNIDSLETTGLVEQPACVNDCCDTSLYNSCSVDSASNGDLLV